MIGVRSVTLSLLLLVVAGVAASAAPAAPRADVAVLLGGALKVFDDLKTLAPGGPPSVIVIATKHPESVRAALTRPAGTGYLAYLDKLRETCRRHTGLRTFVVYYALASPADYQRANARALIVTAMDRSIGADCTAALLALIRDTDTPTIGFCGGHHLIARAYGSKVAQMRQLAPGEADPAPQYHPGWFKEWGFTSVRLLQPNALFAGFSGQLVVDEKHFARITELGPDLISLAATDECPIQAFCHRTKLAFGTQFHPENYDAEHPDGERVISNFLRIAGLLRE